ncbi:MAG: hypothetical protein ABEK04_02430 [Candidatus Nanohalobium sp.]
MIVGFNIDAIDASKQENAGGDLQVNYRPEITDIESAEVNAFEEPVAKIDFTFTVSYVAGDEEAATIEMEGNVLWKGNVDIVTETWDEDQKLPEEIEAPLMNELYRKLLSEAVGIANTLNLLPPIPTPQVDQ